MLDDDIIACFLTCLLALLWIGDRCGRFVLMLMWLCLCGYGYGYGYGWDGRD